MKRSTGLIVGLLVTTLGTARADIPSGFVEPTEDQANEIAFAWRTAVKARDVGALTELGAFGLLGMKVAYTQVTAPADPKAFKRCHKLTTVTTDKAMKAALPCLLTPEIITGLEHELDAGTYAASLDDIPFTSPELKKAWRTLKRLDSTHAFWTFIGTADGVTHSFVIAMSMEDASSTPRVAAVIHSIQK